MIRRQDFKMRTVTLEDTYLDDEGHNKTISVHRSRNSNGVVSIALDVGGQRVFDIGNDVNDYELLVTKIADLLMQAVSDPCNLN